MKVLSIQDISCYGQCSLTVALPVLSSYGVETAILPSAILSNSFKTDSPPIPLSNTPILTIKPHLFSQL